MRAGLLATVLFVLSTTAVVLCNRITLKRKRRGTAAQEYALVPLNHIPYNYYGQVTIGTPKKGGKEQVFTVLFDTGSPHLWITSVGACSNNDCKGNTYKGFDGTKSSTYKKDKTEFKISYVDKTCVKGHLARDNLKLGFEDKQILIRHQVFGEATNVTGHFQDSDGIFGLGFPLKNQMPGDPEPPFISIAKHLNIQPIVGFYLNKMMDKDAGGEVVFGGFDRTLIEGDFTFHDVVKVQDKYDLQKKVNKFWFVKFDKITVVHKGVPQIIYATQNILGLVDTGNNHISGPKIIFDRLNAFVFKYASFKYNGNYSFPCHEKWSALPDVVFTIDGIDYPLTPEDYLWPDNLNWNCRPGFIGHDDTEEITLGTIFIQKYYTVFDMHSKRVAFGKSKTKRHWKDYIHSDYDY